MTNSYIENLLRDAAEIFVHQALELRSVTDHVLMVALVVSQRGDIHVVGIPDSRSRVDALRTICQRQHGVGFTLVGDGYLRLFDSTKIHQSCHGRGCDECRHTGHLHRGSQEAIFSNVRTKWGYSETIYYPYRIQEQRCSALEPVTLPMKDGLDVYGEVWPEQRAVN